MHTLARTCRSARALVVALLALPGLLGGCLVAGECDGALCESTSLDWFTSPCSELGGELTAAGACFIPCEDDTDCPLADLVCHGGNTTWVSGHCVVSSAVRLTRGCGPAGWNETTYGCDLACSAEGRDHECPTGFHCIRDVIAENRAFCTGQPSSGGGGSCGEPCSSGCCSPSGRICCRPPFCSGDCAFSPCCS